MAQFLIDTPTDFTNDITRELHATHIPYRIVTPQAPDGDIWASAGDLIQVILDPKTIAAFTACLAVLLKFHPRCSIMLLTQRSIHQCCAESGLPSDIDSIITETKLISIDIGVGNAKDKTD